MNLKNLFKTRRRKGFNFIGLAAFFLSIGILYVIFMFVTVIPVWANMLLVFLFILFLMIWGFSDLS